MVCQDRWSLMAVVSQDRFHSTTDHYRCTCIGVFIVLYQPGLAGHSICQEIVVTLERWSLVRGRCE